VQSDQLICQECYKVITLNGIHHNLFKSFCVFVASTKQGGPASLDCKFFLSMIGKIRHVIKFLLENTQDSRYVDCLGLPVLQRCRPDSQEPGFVDSSCRICGRYESASQGCLLNQQHHSHIALTHLRAKLSHAKYIIGEQSSHFPLTVFTASDGLDGEEDKRSCAVAGRARLESSTAPEAQALACETYIHGLLSIKRPSKTFFSYFFFFRPW
jgi:hypothetical protein